MLSWSDTKYKFTIGVGTLAIAGMSSELWRDVLPIWVLLVLALPPLTVFVFVHPGELSARLVRIAHVAASVWYLVVGGGQLVALSTLHPLPRGWQVYPPFVAVGAVPCGIVLYRAARGRYQPPDIPEVPEAEPGAAADRGRM